MCDSRCSISDGFRAPYVRKTRHSYCILMACSIWSPLLPCREHIPSSLLILQWSVSLQKFLCSHSWMKTKLHTHTKGKKHMIFFTGGIWVVCWPDALSAVAAVNAETDKAMTSSKKKAGRTSHSTTKACYRCSSLQHTWSLEVSDCTIWNDTSLRPLSIALKKT